MARKNGDVVINLHPFSVEFKVNDDGSFMIEFRDSVKAQPFRRKIVRVHLKRWWHKLLARGLWQLVEHEQKKLDELNSAMKNRS